MKIEMYFKNLLISLFAVVLLTPMFTHSSQLYDHSINDTVFERSNFYYKNRAGDYNFFLEEVPTDRKIFVHLHGCGGIYFGDYVVQEEYLKIDGAVIFINFLKRPGVDVSCPGFSAYSNTSEVSNSRRIDIRRKEAEVLVKNLQSKGYSNIYISGHSEGGRVASTWTLPVSGVIIHGMDCKLSFWNIQRNQKTLVMFNWNDRWLVAQRGVAGCRNFFNKDWVTESTTNDDTSHIPFQNTIHIKAFKEWVLN